MSLSTLTIERFIKELASASPTPGGGSVAALAGAASAGLAAMVARLTVGKKKYRDNWPDMENVRDAADRLQKEFVGLIDRDAEAYNLVTAAFNLPRDDETRARDKAIQSAFREAASVPLETLRTVNRLIAPITTALEKGNPNCLTDTGVAVQLMRAAALGAAYNVRINLASIADHDFTDRLERETNERVERITTEAERLEARVASALP